MRGDELVKRTKSFAFACAKFAETLRTVISKITLKDNLCGVLLL